MPRRREYATNAERQAAYRARHAHLQPPREDLLAALARSLCSALEDAVRSGHTPLPAHLLHPRVDQTLRNLIHYFRGDPPPTASLDADASLLEPENPDVSTERGTHPPRPR